jgi:hypothetical protein
MLEQEMPYRGLLEGLNGDGRFLDPLNIFL